MKNNPKICMEPQKTPNSQSNLEKEEQIWKHHNPDFKLYYQALVIKNNMVLAQKWSQRSMEQTRKSRNRPTFIWSINLQQRRQEYTMGERQPLQ